jgi:hypothetical protein
VAQKLHDTYGYSYDNLKVLLGGWNAWKDKSATDPTGYPVVLSTTPGTSNNTTDNGGVVVTSTIILVPQAPASTP